ncbi:LysR family transcriptional regulator [Paenibacillus terrae HPL-003]|uniref:LysR family transcriptional regulator n=1 Tax=Paenibacillus terrae (strain HPL-003) TaxID=985665 RepID=G7W4H1_PAETH|nr:LysR family transcriptional regulator [Paenibacillus terrae]AET60128.1 LysR family transcriptional regulator [Paenibacillus terrae HPL-003]
MKLLERTKRQVRLTSAGAIFLEEFKNMVSQLEKSIKMTQLASQGKFGHLSIAFVDPASGSLMVNALIPGAFSRREAYVDVQFFRSIAANSLSAC